VGTATSPVYYKLADPQTEKGEHNLPRTPHAVHPNSFDGDHPITTGLLYLMDAIKGSYFVNAGKSYLNNLGDGIKISEYPDGKVEMIAVPEREGVRGRLVLEADFNRYLSITKDRILNDGFNAAGEVRLAKNIAAWLAIGGIDPNVDVFRFCNDYCDDCCNACSDHSSHSSDDCSDD
jgi:hypothetical protein